MRSLADDVAAHPEARRAARVRPRLGGEHQVLADAAAPTRFVDDQAHDLRVRAALERQVGADADPSRDDAVHLGHVERLLTARAQRRQARADLGLRRGVAELTREHGDPGRVARARVPDHAG
jgi:hypothetical protein